MTATITVTRPHRDGVHVLVTLRGEVDLASLDRLTAALSRVSGCADVVVDASGVGFVDCCAVRPLLVAARDARAAGGLLRLRDPSPALVALVAWCGVEDQLPTVHARRRTPCTATGTGAA